MAVYMIGFFLFPIIYQPFHQVHHHDHDHDQIEPSCEHHHDQVAESAYICHSPEHCLICEYEFVTLDLPCLAELVLVSIQDCEQKTYTSCGQVYKSAYSQQSPRAPPKA